MKLVLFYHSFVSCWNHGNAHFLRGVTRELIKRGHDVTVYEPQDGWSRANALADGAAAALQEASSLVSGATLRFYRNETLDIDRATDGADVVLVHEWNSPALIAGIGRKRIEGGTFSLLFHDTHHRAASAPAEMEALELEGYDAVLAFGEALREIYLRKGWVRRAFTWHEAADAALFRPMPMHEKKTDLIWIGNWGDDERSAEIRHFLIEPATRLHLRTMIHGVRYPAQVIGALAARGIQYAGWLPNHRVPAAFAGARATVHVPRGHYATQLAGITTIRVFEALACGIPLVSAPWRDEERLFPDRCFLIGRTEDEMVKAISDILRDRDLSEHLVTTGLRVIATRHTCAHRVNELLSIVTSLNSPQANASSLLCEREQGVMAS